MIKNRKIAIRFWITAAEHGQLDALSWLRVHRRCPRDGDIIFFSFGNRSALLSCLRHEMGY